MQYGDEPEFDGYQELPEGEYNLVIDNVTLDDTDPEKSKIQMVYMHPPTKNKYFQNFVFNAQGTTMKFLQWQLGVLGVWKELKGCEDHQTAAVKAADLLFGFVGSEVLVELTKRDYNGKTYNNITLLESRKELTAPKVTTTKTTAKKNFAKDIPW